MSAGRKPNDLSKRGGGHPNLSRGGSGTGGAYYNPNFFQPEFAGYGAGPGYFGGEEEYWGTQYGGGGGGGGGGGFGYNQGNRGGWMSQQGIGMRGGMNMGMRGRGGYGGGGGGGGMGGRYQQKGDVVVVGGGDREMDEDMR